MEIDSDVSHLTIVHVRVLIKPKQINYIQLTGILPPGQNPPPP